RRNRRRVSEISQEKTPIVQKGVKIVEGLIPTILAQGLRLKRTEDAEEGNYERKIYPGFATSSASSAPLRGKVLLSGRRWLLRMALSTSWLLPGWPRDSPGRHGCRRSSRRRA